MVEKKYMLSKICIASDGCILHRIIALRDMPEIGVKKGMCGGLIEKEDNLSQEGLCWISTGARVYNDAYVADDAQILANAQVYGNAHVFGNAKIKGAAHVCDNARVFGYANVFNHAKVFGNAAVYDDAEVYDAAKVCDYAIVYDHAKVFGNAVIHDKSQVCDNAKVYGDAEIYSNFKVNGHMDIYKNNMLDEHIESYNKQTINNMEDKKMKELKMDLLTNKYTKVLVEEEFSYNAPHTFDVQNAETSENLCHIHFQEGPIKECGVNGVCNEDLINMVICRLEYFQNSEFYCKENALAINALEEALLWLRKRTISRENRGVEGTHTV